MSAKVFISHAAADIDLAESLQDLLDYGIGIPRNNVFCSSDSDSIATGHFFVQTILQELASAEYVACLITPLYLQRQFCLGELGAAQMRNLQQPGLLQALVVPPTSLQEATQHLLIGTQVIKASELNQFKATLDRHAQLRRSLSEWERHYRSYQVILQKICSKYSLTHSLNQLRLCEIEFSVASDPKIHFKHKIYLTFENSGTDKIALAACTWDSTATGVPLAQDMKPGLIWQARSGSAWAKPESPEITVPPKGILRTWIGVCDFVDGPGVLKRHSNLNLGTLTFRLGANLEIFRSVPV